MILGMLNSGKVDKNWHGEQLSGGISINLKYNTYTMEKIISKIEGQIKRLNNRLPDYMADNITDLNLLKTEIKRHKRKSVADRTRNFFVVMFVLAIAALFIGKESYYYMGGIAFFAGLYLASPTARSARIVAYAQQKMFLLQLLQDMKSQKTLNELPESGSDFMVGFD